MKSLSDKFVKMEITTAELRNLPPIHVGFFIGSCLAVNEINLFKRILLLALNTVSKDRRISNEELKVIAIMQAVTIQRNLAAKVVEYLKMLEGYETKCKRGENSSMSAFFTKATAELRSFKDADEYKLARWYRNKVTNHYILPELTSFIMDKKLDRGDTKHSIYLHDTEGNSNFILGEQVLFAKLSENNGSPADLYEKFDDWVIDVATKIVELHNHFCIQIFENHLSEKQGKEFKVIPETHLVGELTEACLPILWKYELEDGKIVADTGLDL